MQKTQFKNAAKTQFKVQQKCKKHNIQKVQKETQLKMQKTQFKNIGKHNLVQKTLKNTSAKINLKCKSLKEHI